jgi:hypothetical protein
MKKKLNRKMTHARMHNAWLLRKHYYCYYEGSVVFRSCYIFGGNIYYTYISLYRVDAWLHFVDSAVVRHG